MFDVRVMEKCLCRISYSHIMRHEQVQYAVVWKVDRGALMNPGCAALSTPP